MKKIYLLLFILVSVASQRTWGQTFTEGLGTVGGTTTIAAHETANGFDNDGFTMTQGGAATAADLRATSPSSGYTGASGGANVFFTTTNAAYGFAIEGIDASTYTSLSVQFGYRKESASLHATFSVDYWDGLAWVPVASTSAALFNEAVGAPAGWYLSKSIALPVGAQISTLKIRFVKTGVNSIRIDDIKLSGTAATGTSTIAAATGTEPATISSLVTTQLGSSINFDFDVKDDGATTGTDAVATKISQLVISQGSNNGVANWTNAIAGAILIDNATIPNTLTGTVNAGNITFASIPNTLSTDAGYIADDATKKYTLQVWLKNPMTGTLDGSTLDFNIQNSGVTLASGSSTFATGQTVSSGASKNVIEVTATKLIFTTEPSPNPVEVATNFTTVGVVKATDANGNVDKDVTSAVTISNSQGFTMANATGLSFSAGILTFPAGFQFTTRTATATTIGVDDGNAGTTDATSAAITVNPHPPAITLTTTSFTSAFGNQCTTSASALSTYTVSGQYLTGNIVITPPAGFQIKLNTDPVASFSNSAITLTQSGGNVAATDIDVRYAPSANGAVSLNITHVTTGGNNPNLGVTGTGVSTASTTASGSSGSVTQTSAVITGSTITPNCYTIASSGIYYGTGANPTAANSTVNNAGNGTPFNSNITTGLSAGQTYHYRSFAIYNPGSVTVYGADLTFTTLKDAPSGHAGSFACGVTTSSTIALSWTAATGMDGYVIKWATTAFNDIVDPVDGSTSNGAASVTVTGLSTTISGLSPTTTYYFKIFPYSNSGSDILYRTAATVPTTSCTTTAGPCISEGFESGSTPAGWTISGPNISIGAPKTGTYKLSMGTTLAQGNNFITAPVTNPNSLSFQLSKTAAGADFTLVVQTSTSSTGPWTDQYTITAASLAAVSPTYALQNVGSLSLASPGIYYIRFYFSQWTSNTAYIDDISVNCTAGSEINVKQATTSLLDASGTYSFGNQEIGSTSTDIQFDIESLGAAALTLTGTPKVQLSNSTDFTVDYSTVSSPVASFTSTSFTIHFNPVTTGSKSSVVTILNDDPSGPGGEGTYTFTVTGNGTDNNTSDIIEGNTSYNNGLSTPIPYLSYQTPAPIAIGTTPGANTVIGVMNLLVRDGGLAHNDNDALETILTGIKFTVKDASAVNQISQIRYAVLTTASGVVFAQGTIVGTELVFSNVAGWAEATAADGGNSNEFILKVSYMNTGITDKTKFVFQVSNVSSLATGSAFFATNGGAAQSDALSTNDKNRIDVVATTLAFLAGPSTTNTYSAMPAVTVRSVDVNGMVDVDYTGTVSITSGGALDATPKTASLSSGVATFTTIIHTATHTAKQLTATLGAFTVSSGNFDINNTAYASGAFLCPAGYTANLNTPATLGSWSKCTGGCTGLNPGSNGWGAVGASGTAPGAGDVVYIANTGVVNISAGSFSVGSIHVLTGGTLNSNVGTAWTVSTLLKIYNGGTVNIAGTNQLTIGALGDLYVEDGGKLTMNYGGGNIASSLWNGTEHFAANSTFEINNYSATDVMATQVYRTTINGYSAAFGNLKINSTTLGATLTLIPSGTGNSTTADNLCHKNLEITNANGQTVRICSNSSTGDVYSGIGGDLIINGSTANTVALGSNSGTKVFTVKGNLTQSNSNASTTFRVNQNAAGTETLNIDGNINISGGNFELASANLSTAFSNVNLKGNLTIGASAASIATNSITWPFNHKLNFTGTTVQEIDASIYTTRIYANVKPNASVLLKKDLVLDGSSVFTVESGGTLNFGVDGSNVPLNMTLRPSPFSSGTNVFAVNSGGTIKITSVDVGGAIVTSGATGNVRTDTRTFDGAAIYHYIGLSNQVTGDGLPTAASAKKVIVELGSDSYTLSSSAITRFNSSGTLEIRKGTVVDNGTIFFADGTGTGENGNLTMSGGIYKFTNVVSSATGGTLYPRFSGVYSLTGGVIDLAANTAGGQFQRLRGGRAYYNIKVSGASSGGGYKNISSTLSISNNLYITGTAIFDLTNNHTVNHSITGTGKLTMDGGRFILGADETQPELSGSPYALTAGVVEFTRTAPLTTMQTIKTETYQNIEVTGTLVGNSNGNITLRSGGTFNVKSGGVFTINADAIVGLAGTQTVTVENNGVFKCGDVDGFSNGTGLTATSVHQTIDNIDLQQGSTVEYTRAGDQPISNKFNTSSDLVYHHLLLTGSGNKTAPYNYPDTTIYLKGDFTKAGTGTFKHNNGEVAFVGTANAQTVSSNTDTLAFYKLTNSNSHVSGLTVASNLNIVEELNVWDATKLTINNSNVTLLSNATKTARVAEVPTGATLTYSNNGKFTVERFYNNLRRWRLVSAPVKNTDQLAFNYTVPTINEAWQEGNAASTSGATPPSTATNPNIAPKYGVHITGPYDGTSGTYTPGLGFDQSPLNNSSMKYYEFGTNAWKSVDNTNVNKITYKQGYLLFVRGDRSYVISTTTQSRAPQTATLRIKGVINRGDVGVPTLSAGFNVIGNPYPSTINFQGIYTQSSSPVVSLNPALALNSFYLYDPLLASAPYAANGSGAWISLLNVGASYVASPDPNTIAPALKHNFDINGDIQSGAAFVVNATAGGRTVNIKETDKVKGSNNYLYRPMDEPAVYPMIRTNLYGAEGTDGSLTYFADGSLNVFGDNFSAAVDWSEDVKKILNLGESFSIRRDGELMSIEARPEVAESDTIFLNMAQMKVRAYRLDVIGTDWNRPDLECFLEDKSTGIKTPVNLNNTTSVYFTVTLSDPTSWALDRFRIVFRVAAGGPLPVTYTSVKAWQQNRDIAVEWKVANELDIKEYEVEKSTDGRLFTKVNTTQAKGNGAAAIVYNWLDEHAVAGTNYYRIRSIDNAASGKYSQVVKVVIGKGVPSVSIYPNPVNNGTIGLQLVNIPKGDYSLRLINAIGQVMFTNTLRHPGGSSTESISTGLLAKGAYQLEITGADNYKQIIKVVAE